jgi:TIR domain
MLKFFQFRQQKASMRVFLSYRSEDTLDEANQTRRYLEELKIGLKPFEYRKSTTAGAPWKKAIRENLLRSDVLVALIGPKWLDLLNKRHPGSDMVRYEIGRALRQHMRVIPLLVAGADMPKPQQLPKDVREMASRTAIRGLKNLAKQICRVKNWVILSERSPFTNELREALAKRGEELGIARYSKFKRRAIDHNEEYAEFLEEFLNEAPHGSWLFTNYAEDTLNEHSEDEENQLIQQLVSQKKRMICFESGHALWLKARRLARKQGKRNPVGVIETNAGHAIEQLIRHMTTHVWRSRKISDIEIVSVMGPLAANTQERGRKYLEFFGCVQHGLNKEPYEEVCKVLGTKVLCTTVTQPMPTWLSKHCRPEIEKFLKLRKPKNKSVHTTFVCGNDDLAFIVYKAVNKRFAADIQEGRVSFVGFDGMPCMDQLRETLKQRAATAKVNFDGMVRVAVSWLRKGKLPAKPKPVSAGVC